MPFKSEKQRRFLWLKNPRIARKWADKEKKAEGRDHTYPEAGKNSPPGVKEAIREFHKMDQAYKDRMPLLYHLLGSSTPAYKMCHNDAEYQGSPKGEQKCGNCIFAYQNVKTKRFICAVMEGDIAPNGWCRLWKSEAD